MSPVCRLLHAHHLVTPLAERLQQAAEPASDVEDLRREVNNLTAEVEHLRGGWRSRITRSLRRSPEDTPRYAATITSGSLEERA